MEETRKCHFYYPWGTHTGECLYYGRKIKSCLHEKAIDDKCLWSGRPDEGEQLK